MGEAVLTINQISENFPTPLRQRNPRGILVEYLQYELLDSLFKQSAASALSFVGGTAIRILFDSLRFSEDLDFDNFGLSFTDFEKLLKTVCRDMEYKGFLIEYRMVEKGSYHCYIRFPAILHQAGLSPNLEQKILIRIDSETKAKLYQPVLRFLNKFAIYRRIQAAPSNILLSQKMMAVLFRKREKGRDIYDVSYLMGLSSPDFEYIEKLLVVNRQEFLRRFEKRLAELDFNNLARDVGPFLFSSDQLDRVITFPDFWNGQLSISGKL